MKLSDPRFIKAMADGYEPPSDAEFRRRGLRPPVERRPYEDVPASICLPPFSVPIRGNPLSPPELFDCVQTLKDNGLLSDDEARGILGAPRRYSRDASGALTLTDHGLAEWKRP